LSREKLLNSPGKVAAIIGSIGSNSEDESLQLIGRMNFSLRQQGTVYPFVYVLRSTSAKRTQERRITTAPELGWSMGQGLPKARMALNNTNEQLV
jgi:hypothetical protein